MNWKRWVVIVVFSPLLAVVALGLVGAAAVEYAISGKWELGLIWKELRRVA